MIRDNNADDVSNELLLLCGTNCAIVSAEWARRLAANAPACSGVGTLRS